MAVTLKALVLSKPGMTLPVNELWVSVVGLSSKFFKQLSQNLDLFLHQIPTSTSGTGHVASTKWIVVFTMRIFIGLQFR